MFEGQRKKGQGICEVKASTELPNDWNDNSNQIASISLTKRKFEIKLNEFIQDLEKYKKGENYYQQKINKIAIHSD